MYVLDGEDAVSEAGAIDVYKPKPAGSEEAQEGELIEQIAAGGMEFPNGIAISSATGQIVVADGAKGLVYVFSGSGGLEAKFNGASSPLGSFGREEAEGTCRRWQ